MCDFYSQTSCEFHEQRELLLELEGWLVVERAVRLSVVVEIEPGFDHYPCIAQIAQPLTIQTFIPHIAAEALHKAI